MIDINFIRENSVEFDNSMKNRGLEPISSTILKIDEEKRNTQTVLQNILAEKNILSKEIGSLKKNNESVDDIVNKVEKLNEQILNLKELEKIKSDELNSILLRTPNITSNDTPIGKNESDNVEIKKYGNKPVFDFAPKQHFEIGEDLNLMNF